MFEKRILAPLVLSIVLAASAVSSAQMGKLDTRYISEEASLVLHFDMQKIYGYEKMGEKGLQSISKFIKNQLGVDVMLIKTMAVQFGIDQGEEYDDNKSYCFVITFSKEVNQKDMLEKFGGDFEETKVHGKTYFKSGETYTPSIYFSPDNVVVVSDDSNFDRLLAPKKGEAPISGLLNSADPTAEIVGAFQMNSRTKMFFQLLNEQLPFKPFDLEKVYTEAQSGFFQGKLKSSTPFFFQAECNSDEAAEKIAKKTKLLTDLGAASIPLGRKQLKEMEKQFDDVPVEIREMMAHQVKSMQQWLDTGEELLTGIEFSSSGKNAIIKIKKMGGVPHVVTDFIKMMSSQFTLIDQMQSDFKEVPDVDLEDVPDLKKDDR